MLSERALCSRINRKLAKMDERCVLKKTRGEGRAWLDLGDYYLLNVTRNVIVEKEVDPWELGETLEVVSEVEVKHQMRLQEEQFNESLYGRV